MSRNFDGVDDEVNLGNMGLWNPSVCSFAFWINPSGFGEGNLGRVFDKAEDATNSQRLGMLLDNTSGTSKFNCRRDAATTDGFADSNDNTIVLNIWQFIGGTYNGSNCRVFYASVNSPIVQDVTNDATDTTRSGAETDVSANNGIIGNNELSARAYQGLIAHPHFYDVVLTIREFSQIMFYPGSVRRGLRAYVPLWGGSPEPEYVSNYNGTVVGAAFSQSSPPINGIFNPKKYRGNLFTEAVVAQPATGQLSRKKRMLVGVGL